MCAILQSYCIQQPYYGIWCWYVFFPLISMLYLCRRHRRFSSCWLYGSPTTTASIRGRSKKGCDFLTRVFAFHFNGPAMALKISFVWGLPLNTAVFVCVFYLFFFFGCCSLPSLCNVVQCVFVRRLGIGWEFSRVRTWTDCDSVKNWNDDYDDEENDDAAENAYRVWSNNWIVEGEHCSLYARKHIEGNRLYCLCTTIPYVYINI